MKFSMLSDGFVSQLRPNTAHNVATGSRCAVMESGDVICSFMLQSKLGVNDFMPVLARSKDNGESWSTPTPLWPDVTDNYSIFGSISRIADNELMYFGARYVIDRPGESFWNEATGGLKQNELFWSRSPDAGKTWTRPHPITMPIPGSAEAPGPICVTRDGRWLCCYAPYPTFDPAVTVDRSQIVAMRSDDCGHTWASNAMLRFSDDTSHGAEAWVIELSDGRLLGVTWHIHPSLALPNAYALSHNSGDSWTPTKSTGVMGQATALTALDDGSALFIYNQRTGETPGIWLAMVKPTDDDFGVLHNQQIWCAETSTQSQTTGEHDDWEDFAYGEPSINVLADGSLLVTFWCVQPSGQGIRYVRLAMEG